MSETQNIAQEATGSTETGAQWEAEDLDAGNAPEGSESVEHEDAADDANPNREAAKWRTKLRESEAQVATLTGQLEAAQRAFAEHLASADGLKPEALWASGVELADLLAEDGRPDAGKVAEAVDAARSKLGIRRGPKVNPAQGSSANMGTVKQDPGNAWQQLLRGGR